MAIVSGVNRKMTGDQFDLWYAQQPEGWRYELIDGVVYPNFEGAPDDPRAQGERVIHNRIKLAISLQLHAALEARRPDCELFLDGMPVLANDDTRFEPDAFIRCGPKLPDDATLVRDPLVVVEIASPSTVRIDALEKLAGYFANPSVRHYLIVLPDRRRAIHHRRMPDGRIEATILAATDSVSFDPPDVAISLADVFGPEEAAA